MTAQVTFPVDDVTIAALQAACECDEEDGRSHLFDFLEFGAVEQSRTQVDSNVFEVTYEPGRAPWSPHQVILALVAEVQRLRTEPGVITKETP